MKARSKIRENKEAEQSVDTEKKKMTSGDESSIFASILADIEENPTILLNRQRNLSLESSILHELNKNPDDFSCTVSKTLTHSDSNVDISSPTILLNKKKKKSSLTRSDLVELLNQELEILESEINIKEQREEEVVFLADQVLEWISKDDDTNAEDEEGCSDEIDEFIEEMLEKVENDGSYLEKIKDEFEFGEFLEGLLRERLRERAEKEEKEIESWISNGELEVETEVAGKQKMKKKKKKSPVKRTEQELALAKRDYSAYRRRLYLIEKLREQDENQSKRRVRAARFGMELSFLVAEYMFLIPNENLEDYWVCLKRLGVDIEDKCTSIIIGKLEEVFEIVKKKKSKNKDYHNNVNVHESLFGFDEFVFLCTDVIPVLGKIVWDLRRIRSERVEVSELDSWFEHCQNVFVKIELKLTEMKQWVYRSVSADYESFSKSERFDRLLKEKIVKRINADNGFGRGVIRSYLVDIWKSVF